MCNRGGNRECDQPIFAEKFLIPAEVGQIGAHITIKDPKSRLRISGDPSITNK
jgi:hypothetical protein